MAWNVTGNLKGPQGDQGPAGADGAQGDPGIQGPPGAPGADGADGATGLQGPPGEQGPAGAVGPAGLTFRGAYDADTDYVEDDAVSWEGSTYFLVTDAPAGTAPSDTDFWAPMALEGSQGPQGPAGVQGPPGNDGATGQRGTQWFVGSGAPGSVPSALPGDLYLDTTSGTVYVFS